MNKFPYTIDANRYTTLYSDVSTVNTGFISDPVSEVCKIMCFGPCKAYVIDYFYFYVSGKKNPYIRTDDLKAIFSDDILAIRDGYDIDNVIDYVNQFEEAIGIPVKTVTYSCNFEKITVFKASKEWGRSPATLSLFYLALRSGWMHKKGKNFFDAVQAVINRQEAALAKAKEINKSCPNWAIQYRDMYPDLSLRSGISDAIYYVSSINGIKDLIKYKYDKIFYKPMKDNWNILRDGKMHETGISSWASGADQHDCPFWYDYKKETIAA